MGHRPAEPTQSPRCQLHIEAQPCGQLAHHEQGAWRMHTCRCQHSGRPVLMLGREQDLERVWMTSGEQYRVSCDRPLSTNVVFPFQVEVPGHRGRIEAGLGGRPHRDRYPSS